MEEEIQLSGLSTHQYNQHEVLVEMLMIIVHHNEGLRFHLSLANSPLDIKLNIIVIRLQWSWQCSITIYKQCLN